MSAGSAQPLHHLVCSVEQRLFVALRDPGDLFAAIGLSLGVVELL